MARITKKKIREMMRAKLKDNPEALAKLDIEEFMDASDWFKEKISKETDTRARVNRYFLRSK